MTTLSEQLQAMTQLGENWDGYGGAPPQLNAIDLAQGLVELLEVWSNTVGPKPFEIHVSPTRIGGVLIEWDDQVAQHEIDISPDNSISFLHMNRSIKPVMP